MGGTLRIGHFRARFAIMVRFDHPNGVRLRKWSSQAPTYVIHGRGVEVPSSSR